MLAMMGIFLLLASQFRSYIQPVIIMMAIPFGLIGAILGHLVMGIEFTIVSIFGIVALSGIVVNDSLILIDFINRALRDGMNINRAVIESGKARFRPVLLTSVTTIAGLFPLLLERSFQAQFLIPMAVSICFGLLAATLLTLLYVPALYLIVQDVINLFSRRRPLAADSGQLTDGGSHIADAARRLVPEDAAPGVAVTGPPRRPAAPDLAEPARRRSGGRLRSGEAAPGGRPMNAPRKPLPATDQKSAEALRRVAPVKQQPAKAGTRKTGAVGLKVQTGRDGNVPLDPPVKVKK
jgi:hypothetical protein